MENKTITVAVVVALLGIAAAIAGFAAEATRVKKSQLTVVYVDLVPECEYPSSPAMSLAIVAVVALVIARGIITSSTGGCCSCCQTTPNLSKFAGLCIIISWITSFIAIILFLVGATLSTRKGVEREINGNYFCYTVRPGLFSGSGIVGLVSVLLGLAYYLLYVSAKKGASGAELELEAPPITDVKKQPIDGSKNVPVKSQKY